MSRPADWVCNNTFYVTEQIHGAHLEAVLVRGEERMGLNCGIDQEAELCVVCILTHVYVVLDLNRVAL